MAEVYEPPSDTQRKYMQRRRGADESPIAYQGALVAFAMAAYPDARPDILDPLILGKMLELSKELGISLPVRGHLPLTSRWATKCLDAQFNLRRWAQMAAWTGDPAMDGQLIGWAPSRVVHISDDAGAGDLAAAAARWVPEQRTESRQKVSSTPHGNVGGTDWRAGMTCFRLMSRPVAVPEAIPRDGRGSGRAAVPV
ncbi:unnamed protein product [Lampetra planeri]